MKVSSGVSLKSPFFLKSNLTNSFFRPVLFNSFRAYALASTPADIKQLTQELAQVEAQKEAYEEAMQVHDLAAGVAAPQDSGMFKNSF